MTAAENIKSNLMAAIRYVETKKHKFTRNPGMDFTRNRKLGMGEHYSANYINTPPLAARRFPPLRFARAGRR